MAAHWEAYEQAILPTELSANLVPCAESTSSTPVSSHLLAAPNRADRIPFADQRGGVYKLPMPFILGNESAGTVVAVGEGVDCATYGFSIGDRVAVRAFLARGR